MSPKPDKTTDDHAVKPLGYGRLARRITSITTNCLLTAVVIVAGLGFGRQVLQWWEEDASQAQITPNAMQRGDGLGDPERLHVVRFGGQEWSLQRQSVLGDHRAAAEVLRSLCRLAVEQEHRPHGEPGEAENRLIGVLAGQQPCDVQPNAVQPNEGQAGMWRLYELENDLPLVVGVRAVEVDQKEADRDKTAGAAGSGDRVVTWGMAMPIGENSWTVCTFQPAAEAGEPGNGPTFPSTPPGCRPTLSMRVVGGGGMIAFEGPETSENGGPTTHLPKTWIQFYDRSFAAHNWKIAKNWQQRGSVWYGSYFGPEPEPTGAVDLHFRVDRRGIARGVLLTTPLDAGGGGVAKKSDAVARQEK